MTYPQDSHEEQFRAAVPAVEQIALERMRLAASVAVAEELLARSDHEQWQDHMRYQVINEFRTWYLADHLADDVCEVDFARTVPAPHLIRTREPATWWDHWKRDKAPRWLLRRLKRVRYVEAHYVKRQDVPVRITETVRVQRHMGYPAPYLRLPEDRFGTPVYVERLVPPT